MAAFGGKPQKPPHGGKNLLKISGTPGGLLGSAREPLQKPSSQ
jgi:hypothetical protein